MDLQAFIDEWESCEAWVSAHTSGSTGTPKEVRLAKSDLAVSARNTNAFFGISPNSVLAMPLSLDYIAGKMMVVRALVAGCKVVPIEPSNQFELPENVDLLAIVPSQAQWLIAHGRGSQQRWDRRIGHVIVGGAAVPLSLQRQLAEAGYDAYCTYGMTETCSHVALSKATGRVEPYAAMPGVRFSLDGRGCLVVEAPEFSFRRVATNDIVQLVDNRHFFWQGRIDNVINSGGVKIHPEALEQEISAFYDGDFYLARIPHAKWGESVAMVIAGDAARGAELVALMKSRLPHAKVPKKFFFVDKLPSAKNGKIRRLAPGDAEFAYEFLIENDR